MSTENVDGRSALLGTSCLLGSQCQEGLSCIDGRCAKADCGDGLHNGAETDVDCGGDCRTKCANDAGCVSGFDCASGRCVSAICMAPGCEDGLQNGDEVDVDCGGSCTAACKARQKCRVASDCDSGVCTNSVCIEPHCNDGLKNGDETDVDCGGGACGGCLLGAACENAGDCRADLSVVSVTSCATVDCWANACTLVAKDLDGDGWRSASCKQDNGRPVVPGDDCNDNPVQPAAERIHPTAWDGPGDAMHTDVCDAVDDDCNGVPDDSIVNDETGALISNCKCALDAPCAPSGYTLTTLNNGTCRPGKLRCTPEGTPLDCVDAILPIEPICAGPGSERDNNCDGNVDTDASSYTYCETPNDYCASRKCGSTGACEPVALVQLSVPRRTVPECKMDWVCPGTCDGRRGCEVNRECCTVCP